MSELSKAAATPGLRCVLFVDDDDTFLQLIKEMLVPLSAGQWNVITADSASRAFAVLQEQPVDLAVMDAQMPVMDGLQMLTLLNRGYPNVQKVVLTGLADEAYRAACLRSGAELVLEKPAAREGWQSLFTVLNELVKFHPEEGFRGVMRRVGLADVIQMECLARKSSVLEISNARTHGQIFVEEGQIIHAQIADLTGEAALNQLLSITGGQFNLKPFVEPATRTISGQWEFLLMEAARKADESAQSAATPASTLNPDPLAPVFVAKRDAAPDTDIFPIPKARTETKAEPARPTVEEVLICSERGEVLQEWQCRNDRAWISFFELLARKAHDIERAAATGEFDRLEMLTGDTRAVVILGSDRRVLIRTRQEGRSVGHSETDAGGAAKGSAKPERIKEWLRDAPKLAGMLVRGVRFGEGKFAFDSLAPDFLSSKLESAWNAVADTYQALHAPLPSAEQMRWVYANAVLHSVRRDDNAVLGVLVTKESGKEDDQAALVKLLAEFRSVGS